MLRPLSRFFRRATGSADPAQLALDLTSSPALRDGDDLLIRLRTLGLRRIEQCRLTRNRNVLVSFSGTVLRVHEGFLGAPEQVLRAIVVFVEGRTRADRRDAQRAIVSHPVRSSVPPRARRESTHPDDEPLAAALARHHTELNARHFAGSLRAVPIRVSRRMKSRLGHYTAPTSGDVGEIAISRRHIRRHGWDEAVHTLLHEMVHQWQHEQGHVIDHGPHFRRKAREVGIVPAARRIVSGATR